MNILCFTQDQKAMSDLKHASSQNHGLKEEMSP